MLSCALVFLCFCLCASLLVVRDLYSTSWHLDEALLCMVIFYFCLLLITISLPAVILGNIGQEKQASEMHLHFRSRSVLISTYYTLLWVCSVLLLAAEGAATHLFVSSGRVFRRKVHFWLRETLWVQSKSSFYARQYLHHSKEGLVIQFFLLLE